MLKPLHYYCHLYSALLSNLKEIPWPLKLEKRKKKQQFSKNLKIQILKSFCVFVFVEPKHIAHKMVITSTFVSEKAFINF